MKRFLKWTGIVLGSAVVLFLLFFAWASWRVSSIFSERHEAHEIDFPVPFPLADSELQRLREQRAAELAREAELAPAEPGPNERAPGVSDDDGVDSAIPTTPAAEAEEPAAVAEPADPLQGVDLNALALERAVERGKHLVEARYACAECHAADLGGGTMMDEPPIGSFFGPNLTAGNGGVVADYAPSDWDLAVRHGILPNGRPSMMPSEDYTSMSDRELSDIVAYIQSLPPVDRAMDEVSLGPVGTILVATGEFVLSVETIDHEQQHLRLPPPTAPTVEFGRHLAAVCTGCHNAQPRWRPDGGWPAGLAARCESHAAWRWAQRLELRGFCDRDA